MYSLHRLQVDHWLYLQDHRLNFACLYTVLIFLWRDGKQSLLLYLNERIYYYALIISRRLYLQRLGYIDSLPAVSYDALLLPGKNFVFPLQLQLLVNADPSFPSPSYFHSFFYYITLLIIAIILNYFPYN